MSFYIGQNAVLGVALQDEASGETFGHAICGTYDYMRVKPGGFKYEVRNAKNTIDELNVDPSLLCVGGLYYTWTAELVMSYSYREKLFMLALGSTDDYVAGPPMVHGITPADKIRFGSIQLVYTDEAAQDDLWITETFSNTAITSLSLKQDAEGELTLSVSGVATAMTRATDFAGQSITITTTEPVCWGVLTPSLDGTTTFRLGSISMDVDMPSTEGEFDMAASTPNTLAFLGRSGPRTVKYGVDIRMDAGAYTLVGDTSGVWDGANSLVWNNGAAGADNRIFSLVFGESYVTGAGRTPPVWGRETRTLDIMPLDGTTRVLTVAFTNARSGVIAVT